MNLDVNAKTGDNGDANTKYKRTKISTQAQIQDITSGNGHHRDKNSTHRLDKSINRMHARPHKLHDIFQLQNRKNTLLPNRLRSVEPSRYP